MEDIIIAENMIVGVYYLIRQYLSWNNWIVCVDFSLCLFLLAWAFKKLLMQKKLYLSFEMFLSRKMLFFLQSNFFPLFLLFRELLGCRTLVLCPHIYFMSIDMELFFYALWCLYNHSEIHKKCAYIELLRWSKCQSHHNRCASCKYFVNGTTKSNIWCGKILSAMLILLLVVMKCEKKKKKVKRNCKIIYCMGGKAGINNASCLLPC